ncbi:MAG: homoserine O-acetyltransferase [Kiritimatiellae bacterium]|jgi:homoserine O-acetyltransferase|nr:homoserine O-acetyltransferase [Kiritimatiellia bacterium]
MIDTANKENSLGIAETQIIKLTLPQEGFQLEKGGTLHEIDVAYESYGTINNGKDNVVLICHALTGDAHAAGSSANSEEPDGWWDDMIGPGKGIDTNIHQVICTNILGGCKGTTGPASVNPETGKAYGSSFPKITVADIVEVQRLLLQQLGITKLAALVGGSFGGMQILEWLIRHSEEVERAVIIASAASLTTQALAFDIVGRHAITSDPNWNNGDYYNSNQPIAGLSGARKIAHITYLSQQLMSAKFGREKQTEWMDADADFQQSLENKFGTYFQIESYLEYQGKKFIQRFDANSYLHITLAMDEYDTKERYGSLEKAFEKITSRLLIVSLSGDWLFTRQQSADMVKALVSTGKRVSYFHLEGEAGHDAFLTHIHDLKRIISAFLIQPEREKCTHVHHKIPNKEKLTRFKQILKMIPDNSRVLDLGCGKGSLLNMLRQHHNASGIGVEIEIEALIAALTKGCDVLLEDIDDGLKMIPDKTFDVAVLSETLQTIKRPRVLLQQILRVADKALISFPNFASIGVRTNLLFNGRMPKGKQIPFEWYNTPNIHLFTLADFLDLCEKEEINVESIICKGRGLIENALLALGFKNLGASAVIIHISKKEVAHSDTEHAEPQSNTF